VAGLDRVGTEDAAGGDHRAEISLDSLIRLRWWAVAGQLVTIGTAQITFGHLRLARLLVLVAVLAATNALLVAARRWVRAPRLACGAVLTLDSLLLTAMLHAAGGANNPFSVVYLVYIALAATVLGPRWTWFLAALSVGCFGLLFALQDPHAGALHNAEDMKVHLRGMWLAFSAAAVLTAYFVVKLSTTIERRDAAIADMKARVARHERLAAVTTMAAGAAHELGTPLATIAVASRELEHAIRGLPAAHREPLVEDAALIRSELERCRAILDRLSADTGHRRGEEPVELRAGDVVRDIVGALTRDQQARVQVRAPENGAAVRLPRSALLQVAQNLLRNALDAGDGAVEFLFEATPSGVRMVVRDHGKGMTRDVLERVGEPFFSTKPPGGGLGLGVFIARTLSEQMGGRLSMESQPGQGTTATVEIGGR
jgi:two-component system sensor histidine kinase RegB